jgi:hypothetical protein
VPAPAAPNFNQAAVQDVFGQVESICQQIGRFEVVTKHEPKNSPPQGIYLAIWIDRIRPIKRSGLAATSGALCLRIRIYMPFQQQPYDLIDQDITTGVSELMGAFTGYFDFQSADNIRGIDIFGGEGSGELFDAQAGYLEMDRKHYRVMTIRLPIIINDMWTQAG